MSFSKGDKVTLTAYKTTGTVVQDESLEHSFIMVERDDTKRIQSFHYKNLEHMEFGKK